MSANGKIFNQSVLHHRELTKLPNCPNNTNSELSFGVFQAGMPENLSGLPFPGLLLYSIKTTKFALSNSVSFIKTECLYPRHQTVEVKWVYNISEKVSVSFPFSVVYSGILTVKTK